MTHTPDYSVDDGGYVDRGAACEDKPNAHDCFLEDKQRERLIAKVTRLIGTTAQTNYKLAIADLKVTELLKKEEDLHWVLGLALDLAGAHLITVLGTALKAVQARGAAKLFELQLGEGMAGQFKDSSWLSRAETAIAIASPTRIDAVIRAGLGLGMPKAKAAAQAAQNHASMTKKSETLSFLNQLLTECDVAFERLINAISAGSDAELVVAHEGFQPQHHTVPVYVSSLQEKINRFHASGVTTIGRTEVNADEYGGTGIRDTRVVFVQDIHGNKTPWYQSADGSYEPGIARPGDPKYEAIDPKNQEHKKRWTTFGPRQAGRETLDRPVPQEFRDVAIARSEARWGPTITIDDGYVAMLKQQGVSVDNMRARLNGSPLFPTRSALEETSSQRSSTAGLMPDSIFGLPEKEP